MTLRAGKRVQGGIRARVERDGKGRVRIHEVNRMASKLERIKVEVKESTAGSLRTFDINLTAPVGDFLLTDLLRQRGVIDPLDVQLRQVVREATETYLSTAEILIAGLATEQKPAQKTRVNGNGKVSDKSNETRNDRPNEKEQTGTSAHSQSRTDGQ